MLGLLQVDDAETGPVVLPGLLSFRVCFDRFESEYGMSLVAVDTGFLILSLDFEDRGNLVPEEGNVGQLQPGGIKVLAAARQGPQRWRGASASTSLLGPVKERSLQGSDRGPTGPH